jgi:hypothetical protein
MSDLEDDHGFCRIVDFIENAIVANANPPNSLGAAKHRASRWTRIIRKRAQLSEDLRAEWRRYIGQLFLSLMPDRYGVTHVRLRSISSNACWRGIGFSPAAFAARYSRTVSRSSKSSRSSSYSLMSSTTAIGTSLLSNRICLGLSMARYLERVYLNRRSCSIIAMMRLLFVAGGGDFQDG